MSLLSAFGLLRKQHKKEMGYSENGWGGGGQLVVQIICLTVLVSIHFGLGVTLIVGVTLTCCSFSLHVHTIHGHTGKHMLGSLPHLWPILVEAHMKMH